MLMETVGTRPATMPVMLTKTSFLAAKPPTSNLFVGSNPAARANLEMRKPQ